MRCCRNKWCCRLARTVIRSHMSGFLCLGKMIMKQGFLFDLDLSSYEKKIKSCTTCGEDDISKFNKDKSGHQGLKASCRLCNKKAKLNRQGRNYEKEVAFSRYCKSKGLKERPCTKCGENKLSEFSTNSRGHQELQSVCKSCFRNKHKDSTAIKKNNQMIYRKHCEERGLKEKPCTKCGENDVTKFNEHESGHRGLSSICDKCLIVNRKIHYSKNRDSILSKGREYLYRNRDKKLERDRKYYHNNKEDKARHRKEYYKKNKEYFFAKNAKRRATKLRAIPKNQQKEEIGKTKELYSKSDRLTKETGEKYHVDHIVPLQGKLTDGKRVLGAHRIDNLQILEASNNISKGNRITYEELAKYKEGHHYIFVPEDYFDNVDKYPNIGFN